VNGIVENRAPHIGAKRITSANIPFPKQ